MGLPDGWAARVVARGIIAVSPILISADGFGYTQQGYFKSLGKVYHNPQKRATSHHRRVHFGQAELRIPARNRWLTGCGPNRDASSQGQFSAMLDQALLAYL
jgi:hypothetical protein